MFDIHLAWSPISLLLVHFALIAVAVVMLYQKVKYKVVAIYAVLMLAFIHFAAWDVGTRQSDLHRSQFNTGTIELENVEKVEVERLTRDKIRVQFEAEIQERKEERDE